ncbi:type VI secretion protein IcmF/TssM N-terminal domain-containing protein [Dyella jiangningensis]|nr:type VI secretion protein IcmF/TssM N-terminal domain-containing protein [Dyella jiangningensis]
MAPCLDAGAMGVMRLLECYAPLFSYGLLIEEQASTPDGPGELATVQARARAIMDEARGKALAAGKPLADVEMAGFAAVAWFDEIVMRQDAWKHLASPLQLELFGTASAASEFFDHLARLPPTAEEVREVFGMALMLGYVGQYYYEQDDSGELGRIKALYCRPSITAPGVLQSLQREPITPQPYLAPGSQPLRLPASWVGRRSMQFVAAAVVLLVLVAFVAPVFSHVISMQTWSLLGLGVVAASALAWAGALAWHRLVVMRAHTRVASHPEASYGIGDVWSVLLDAARHVRGTVLHPFRRRGEWRKLSRHPWLMFLGDSAAEVRSLLQAAAHAPHARSSATNTEARPWYWWIFRSVVAIEPGGYLLQAGGEPHGQASSWSQALALLARERRKLPLDGMVLCVSAQSLLESTTQISARAARLQEMAGEATRHLQLQLPLYVVVTGLEALPGHAAVRSTLPSAVFRRVLGWRIALPSPGPTPLHGRMDVRGEEVGHRLRGAALAALAVQRHAHGRREVFAFLQSLPMLQRGLQVFLDRLMAGEGSAGRRLLWCGLYLTGGARPSAPSGDFVDDLFGRFLSADRLLARRIAAEG